MSCQENFRLEDFFDDGLKTNGNSTAVIFDDSQVQEKISYLEAKQHCNKISQGLRNASCCREIIGLVLNASVFSPITLLGVLKVPAVFINIDVNIPCEKLHFLITKLKLRTFVISAENITSFREKCEKFDENIEMKSIDDLHIIQFTNVHPEKVSDDLAYVITTSGTTGSPKIVRVPHKCIVPNIRDLSETFHITSKDTVFHATPLTFDPSMVEIFMTFASGGTLLVVPPVLKMMPKILANILTRRHTVSVLQATPTLISSFGKEILQSLILSESSCLKILALGGEAFPLTKVLKTWIQEGNKTRFFNLYGITEVSCWSTIQEITHDDIRNERDVYLGKPLRDTVIFVDTENSKESNSNSQDIGELFVGGERRHCIIDNENSMSLGGSTNTLRSTGDFVRVSNGQLEYIGRKDEQISRNGCRINLSEIEKVAQGYDGVESACIVPTKDDKIYLFVSVMSQSLGEITTQHKEFKKEIVIYLKSFLPVYSQPDDVILLNSPMPVTNHGKIDRRKLLEMRDKMSLTFDITEEDIKDRVVEIVSESLGFIQKSCIKLNSSFLENGGNSLSAVTLYDKLCKMIPFKCPLLLEKILYSSLEDVINYIKESFSLGKTEVESTNKFPEKRQKCQNHSPMKHKRQKKLPESVTHFDNIKDVKTHSYCDSCTFNNYQICIQRTSKIKCYYNCGKCDRNKIVNEERRLPLDVDCDVSKAEIVQCWKWSLGKCIDASPLLVIQREDKRTVFIGSHSFLFAAIDFDSGSPLWTQTLENRIESSACLLLDGKTICVGCYSGYIYFLAVTDGSDLWKFQVEGEVKSSPVVNSVNGLVYFGSHDKHVYALDPKKKVCVWKKCLDMSSIFSSPCISSNNSTLYVATLGGKLFALDSNAGDFLWKFDVGKPIFSSPCIYSDGILVGSVGGHLIAVNKDGKQIWKFQTGGPIFSSPSSVTYTMPDSPEIADSLIVFGSHDCSVYCVTASGNIRWRYKTDSEIYSSPFVFSALMQQENKPALSTEDSLKMEKQEKGEFCKRQETPLVAACSTKGYLYILKLLDGKLIAKYKFPSDIFSSPVVFEDKLVLGCRNDYLYCVKLDFRQT